VLCGGKKVKIVLMVLMLILSLGVIASVLLQSGRSAGLSGAITGGAEVLFGKKKGLDDFLSKITIVLAVLFFLLNLVISMIQ
jgi:preprotein translocase subunit SecG